MGVFAKTLLQLLAAAVLLAIGYFFPSALASILSWLDATAAALADNAEPTGTFKLILQFAGVGFAVLMALLVIMTGFAMRQFVSETFFRWRYVLTAGLIPLLAHVVKWGLGLWWPALLVPVHALTGVVYNWFSAETQIQLDLFNFKGHVMTIILGLVLIMLWSLVTFLWRWFFGHKAVAPSSSPQPPAPSGNAKGKIMSIFEKPMKFYREKVKPIFSKTADWIKRNFRKNPAPAAGGQQPPAGGKWGKIKSTLMKPFNWVKEKFRKTPAPASKDNEPKHSEKSYGPGLTLGPIDSLILFVGLTLLISMTMAGWIYWSYINPGNPTYFSQKLVSLPVIGLLTVIGMIIQWIWREERDIPNNHVATLKVLGEPFNTHLSAGKHRIPLAWLFSSNRDNVIGDPVKNTSEQSADNPGLVYVGDVTVILDDEHSTGDDGTVPMSAVAADKAKVGVRPTFTYRCISPLQRLGRDKPIKDMNEAARTLSRDIIAELSSSRQLNGLSPAFAALADGYSVYFISARRSDAENRVHVGDIVTDKGTGKPIYMKGKGVERDETIVAELLKTVIERGNQFMLAQAIDDSKTPDYGTLMVTHLHVSTRFEHALEENGYTMIGVPRTGEVTIPGRITDAAGQAAAEIEERDSAIATASAAVAAGQVLQDNGKGMDPKDAAMAGFLRETPAAGKVIHLTGGQSSGVIVNTN